MLIISLAVSLLLTIVGTPVHAQAPQAGPRLVLNPERAHISVFAPPHWNLRFYGRPDLSGPPVIELTDEGLRVEGILACSWPGGGWVEANAANMVLGYKSVDARQYQQCVPQDLPLISTWSDQGNGAAAIYIEVVARRGAIIESLWGIRRVYLDMNALPGDPREAIGDANLRTKGFLGWEWLLSEHEERQQIRAAYDQLLRQPAFTAFIVGVRACLSSERVPDCLAPFVETPFYHPDAAAALGKPDFVTADELVRYAWAARGGGTGRVWEDLRSCLIAGEPVAVAAQFVQLSGAVFCTVERGRAGWKLTAFFAGG